MAEILKWFGCHDIFGVGGDFAANLIAALSDNISLSPAGNEMHAGFTACGHAEFNGIGAALTTYTVGSLPCTSAAALAITEKLPVIFISGAPGENEISHHTIHHTIASASTWRAEYDCALDAFRALGMQAERLQGARNSHQPNMAAERFFQLVAHAFTNKQPVFIEVPRDLVFLPTQAITLPKSLDDIQSQPYVLKGELLIANQIIDKLKQAKKPLIYIGENVKLNAELCSYIMDFCHTFNVPYATCWLAKGVFDETDPLSVGSYNGVFSREQNRRYIEKEVDYVLEVDTSIYLQDTNAAFNTGTHSIHNFKNKTVIKGSTPNQQDLIKIFERLINSNIPPFEVALRKQPTLLTEANEKVDFHNITTVLNGIQQTIEQSLIYLPEVGNSYFASYDLITKRSVLGRSWITNPWYAAMGTSLPYARSVAKALKSKKTKDIAVVITGDGGFNFQLNELIHFQRESLTVIIIYMRNDIFHLGKSGEGEIYQCSTPDFDALKLVEAFGGRGARCKTVGEFSHEMVNAIKANSGISLIEVPADTALQYQCHEIKMLNLYIQAKNGNPEAKEKWQALTELTGV
ncbi:thiamine pyrophosphate-binding protein [Thalassotalea sp. M1531]|uniref:Thiamine pyrophosphate-binding protein n=2 Tax=Thalassotalea algicola TaxID=2716224 RepID=A0A7Y0Q6U1_9GAMM|nr:thiamine pyrophosphate-binding protein [Thalassotalea algicola]